MAPPRSRGSDEPDPARRIDHGGLATLFAEAAGCAPAWKKALEGWNVVQSQVVQEWIDMGFAKGESKGELKGRIETLLEVLEGRFGTPPADLAAAIRQIDDLPRLRRLAVLAGQADSLERFRHDGGL